MQQRTGQTKTLYHAVNELLRSDIRQTVPAQAIQILQIEQQGVSIREGTNEAKHYIRLEDLLSYDPDYIIINGEDVTDYIQSNSRLHVLAAYKENNIHNLPAGISRWGQPNSIETALFIKWLAKIVYPEYFADLDLHEEVKRFYRTYFDAELSDDRIDEILSGRNLRQIEKNQKPGNQAV